MEIQNPCPSRSQTHSHGVSLLQQPPSICHLPHPTHPLPRRRSLHIPQLYPAGSNQRSPRPVQPQCLQPFGISCFLNVFVLPEKESTSDFLHYMRFRGESWGFCDFWEGPFSKGSVCLVPNGYQEAFHLLLVHWNRHFFCVLCIILGVETNGSIEGAPSKKWKTAKNKSDVSRKAKLNELRFYRLKAKKKMNSPNPEVRIRYKLEKAKRKEAWLIEKLRKYELPKGAPETYDPEILTEEERFYLKRTGDKKKHYVPVGRRGVFGGVVLNMHLHWKKHETVKVICKPCKTGQVHQYAEELTRLSKGIIIDIKQNNTIIFYRGKNYVQPDVMSPTDTLSKAKALEKYRYEQSLEHTSEFIERLENELAEFLEHRARYKKEEK